MSQIDGYSSANWKSRAEIIDYCAQVVDSQLHEKENALNEILNSKMSTDTGLLSPPKVDGEIWRGPTNDFYRPVERSISTSRPPNSADGSQPSNQARTQQSAQDLQEEARRQRDREKDARYALWEERVKGNEETLIFDIARSDGERVERNRVKMQLLQ
ncbi:6639_t:CDS:2, partial [Acaulospora colombiana]